jgi:hypothetical protein
MKIPNLIVLVIIYSMITLSCKDNKLHSPDDFIPNKTTSIESNNPPFQFSFNSHQINQLNEDLELVSKAITYLCNDSTFKEAILSAAAISENDEVVYLWYLEMQLENINISLLASMQAALSDHGFSNANVNRLSQVYKTINLNDNSYNTLIHIPFIENVNFDAIPLVTYQFQPIEQLSDLKVFTLSSEGELEITIITEEIATSQPSLFVSMESFDGVQYAALPWHQCECTRDSQNAPGWVSSMGICVSRGDCHKCGRATFKGDCGGGKCAGC